MSQCDVDMLGQAFVAEDLRFFICRQEMYHWIKINIARKYCSTFEKNNLPFCTTVDWFCYWLWYSKTTKTSQTATTRTSQRLCVNWRPFLNSSRAFYGKTFTKLRLKEIVQKVVYVMLMARDKSTAIKLESWVISALIWTDFNIVFIVWNQCFYPSDNSLIVANDVLNWGIGVKFFTAWQKIDSCIEKTIAT